MRKASKWKFKVLQCSHKKSYPTKGAAQYLASKQAKKSGEYLNSYKCKFGPPKHWHMGHPPGSGKRDILIFDENTDVVK